MPPKKGKTAVGHVKCDPIAQGTVIKTVSKKEIIVGKEFAQGGFGRICDAKVVGRSEKYIIKLEPSGNGPLFTEMHVFQRILRPEMLEAYAKKNKLPHLGLPSLVDSGMYEEVRYLVMPKFAHCLDEVVKSSKAPMKVEDVADVLKCISHALKYMHDNDYVHADIKAANIMMNDKKSFNKVYLIDFGLAKKVGTVVEKEDKKKAHDGTALFTSTDAHKGCGFTYRGDVEILAHNTLFWLTKQLPWQHLFDEEATLKVKNEQLNEIRAAKEKLIAHLSTDIKKLVPDSTAASMILMLYKASKIDINMKPDFDALIKNLNVKGKNRSTGSDTEEAIEPPPSARRGRKPAPPGVGISSEEEEPTSSKPVKTPGRRGRKTATEDQDSTSPKKTAPKSALRGRKPVSYLEEENSEDDLDAPKEDVTKSTRRGRTRTTYDDVVMPTPKNRKKKSESDMDEHEPPNRKAKIAPTPTASSTRRGRGRPTVSDTEAITTPASSSRRIRNHSESQGKDIIPGLATKKAGKGALSTHKEECEEDELTSDTKANDIIPGLGTKKSRQGTKPSYKEESENEEEEEKKPINIPKPLLRSPVPVHFDKPVTILKTPPKIRDSVFDLQQPIISGSPDIYLPTNSLIRNNDFVTQRFIERSFEQDRSPRKGEENIPPSHRRQRHHLLDEEEPRARRHHSHREDKHRRPSRDERHKRRAKEDDHHHQHRQNHHRQAREDTQHHREPHGNDRHRQDKEERPFSPPCHVQPIQNPSGCSIM